jgi:glycosyltransferase involved in cell wall biosynthesis
MACPERTGDLVERNCSDSRVTVLRHKENRGVGGALVTGYRAALADGADIVVKVDGDGQMDPAFIPILVRSIVAGRADYAKGNRLHDRSCCARCLACA